MAKKVQEESSLKVYMSFKDDALPGLIVVWQVGSNKLDLCRIGGPKGNVLLEEKTHYKYKTAEGAHAGAVRWFKVLANIYNVAPTVAKQRVVVTH